MAKRLVETRRKALLAVVLISMLIFLLSLTGNPYVALSSYLFGAAKSHGRNSGPTVYRYGKDEVAVVHGNHRLYADRVDRLSDASVSIIHRSQASLQITANCSSATKLGATTAASWMLCTAGPFRPQPPCFVFSFDINAQWRLEASNIVVKFDCQVLVFDPTMQPPKSQLNSRIVHLKEGLHHPKAMGSLVTDTYLGHLKRLRAESVVIDVLEVNIGDSGWQAIGTAIADESVKNVKQLLLAVTVSKKATVEMMREEIRVIALLDQIGFRMWHHSQRKNRNLDGGFVRQFHFINQHFAAVDNGRAKNSDTAVANLRDSLRQLTLKGE